MKDEISIFSSYSFKTEFMGLESETARINRMNGWYESNPSLLEQAALIHSEVSEMVEGSRHGNPPSEHIPAFSAIEEELADIIIRCADVAKRNGYDIPGAIAAKLQFNANRGYRHGGKKI